MIRLILAGLTGGRPMTLLRSRYFIDTITGRPVHLYMDFYGRTYMAENRWGWFRVGVNPTCERDWDA